MVIISGEVSINYIFEAGVLLLMLIWSQNGTICHSMIGTNCQIWKIMISHRWGGQTFGGGSGSGGGVGVDDGGGDVGGEDDVDDDDDDDDDDYYD